MYEVAHGIDTNTSDKIMSNTCSKQSISDYFKNKIITFFFNKYTVIKMLIQQYIFKYRNKIILIIKDSESIEGDSMIIEYIFTEVTTNYI